MNARFHPAAALPHSVTSRSIDELDAAICRLARQMNAQTYRLLMLVREFDDRLGWAKWGFRHCAEWLAWRCGLTLSAAREKVRTAQALRALPFVSEAFADGRLSYSKVRALTRVAHYGDEQRLLQYALGVTAAQVEERCREIRNASAEDSIAGARRAWERRRLTLIRNEVRGTMLISVEVPLVDGEVIARAIERAAEVEDRASGIEFEAREPGGVRDCAVVAPAANGWCAQQADALVAVARVYLGGALRNDEPDAGRDFERDSEQSEQSSEQISPQSSAQSSPQSSARSAERHSPSCAARNASASPTRVRCTADHHLVVVHADASALRGGIGRSDLPIDVVKRLACDGSVVTVVEDDAGTPLDVGRRRRTVSTALRRALWSRDRHCAFPGCRNARYVDAHHVRHWIDGGETSLDNTVLLCTHHHTLLHEGGFSMGRDEHGARYFRRPDGRVIPRDGYNVEDFTDEVVGDGGQEVDRERGAERSLHARNPSAEVREVAPAYLLRPPPRSRSLGYACTVRAGAPARYAHSASPFSRSAPWPNTRSAMHKPSER